MRIAFFTPLNPVPTGISDYSEDLLPHLGKYCEIDVFTNDPGMTNETIAQQFHIYSHSQFKVVRNERSYDALLFQIADSSHHVEAYEHLLEHGGLMVLHELNISGVIGAKTLAKGDWVSFLKQMLITEGVRAFISVAAKFLITRQFPRWNDYCMNTAAIRKSDGIIVHNEYMRELVSDMVSSEGLDIPVWKVLHGVPSGDRTRSIDPHMCKERLGLDGYDFVVSSFGAVHESKRIPVVLRSFSRLRQVVPNAIYVLVGSGSLDDLCDIRALGLQDRVRMVGYVDMKSFYRYIAASDLCVSLRYPSVGETSGSLLRIMSMAKAVAISDYAQFKEYPDDCCFKIELGEGEEDTLFKRMYEMASNPALRAEYGRNALKYMEENHSLGRAALGYYRALEQVARGKGI